MPKAKFDTVTGARVDAIKRRLVVLGRGSAGREVEADLPLEAMPRLAAEAKRAVLTSKRLEAGQLEQQGEWGEVVPIGVRTWAAGSLVLQNAPNVALTFDRGLETELTFALDPESARALGQKLIEESERCKTLHAGTSH